MTALKLSLVHHIVMHCCVIMIMTNDSPRVRIADREAVIESLITHEQEEAHFSLEKKRNGGRMFLPGNGFNISTCSIQNSQITLPS